jgi:4-amino-4-deoxy-L-arabinose transferase-like glycosyltransferase
VAAREHSENDVAMVGARPSGSGRRVLAAALAIALVAWAGLVLVRWSAPSDLLTRDQERVGTYILDVTDNGAWLVQRDMWGEVASKPPLFNWLAAVATEAAGRISRASASWPSWFVTLVTTLLVFGLARRAYGIAAGVWAVMLYLFSQLGLRQVLLIRTDALFQAFVFLGALAAWRAWRSRGRGWMFVWTALVLASMTKAPHAIAFASFGLVAVWWRSGIPVEARVPLRPGAWREHAIGLGVLLIAVCWLVAALTFGGDAVREKWFEDELVGHLVDDHGQRFGEGFAFSIAWFLTRAAPAGVLASLAVWRMLRRGAASRDPELVAFERFWACQMLGVVLLIGFGSKVRFVHLLPALPAAAMLGAGELSRLLTRVSPVRQLRAAAIGVVVLLAGSAAYLHVADPAENPDIALGIELERFARAVEERVDPHTELVLFRPSPELVKQGVWGVRDGVLSFYWDTWVRSADAAGVSEFLAGADSGADSVRVALVAQPDLVRSELDVEALGLIPVLEATGPNDLRLTLQARPDAAATLAARAPRTVDRGVGVWWLVMLAGTAGVAGFVARAALRLPRFGQKA